VLTVLPARTATAQPGWLPEEFTAVGISGNSGADDAGSSVEIRIARWSTAADEESLARALFAGGAEGLLDAVRDAPPVGSIQSPGSLVWSLRFAWQQQTAHGRRRILILADRPIGGWERLLDSPSLAYPFSVIEIWIERSGEGDGVLSVATRIIIDPEDGLIDVEGYGAVPVRLTHVRSRRPT
jgi:hypothetical protein